MHYQLIEINTIAFHPLGYNEESKVIQTNSKHVHLIII
jgi:hypothetical protein